MEQQRYKATWIDQEGRTREFIFESSDNLMLARIDFKLKLIGRGVPRPEVYELDEVHGVQVQTGRH